MMNVCPPNHTGNTGNKDEWGRSIQFVRQLNNNALLTMGEGHLDLSMRYLREAVRIHSHMLRSYTDKRCSQQQQQQQQQQPQHGSCLPPPPPLSLLSSYFGCPVADEEQQSYHNVHNMDTNDGSVFVPHVHSAYHEKEGQQTPTFRGGKRPRHDSLSAFMFRRGVMLTEANCSNGTGPNGGLADERPHQDITTCAVLLYNLGLAHHERATLCEGYQTAVGKDLILKAIRMYSMAMHLIESLLQDDSWLLWSSQHQSLALGLANNLGQIYYELGNHDLSLGFFQQTNGALSRLVTLLGSQDDLELPPPDVAGLVFNSRLLLQSPMTASAA